ncbi:MAG: NADPH:quinone reductase [Phycisphaerae bacterium]|nr:NADPH:quinone reductase [Phycisphaerae bacterium]
MKTIRVAAFGDPEVMRLEEVPDPVPAAGQVVVRIHAAGVNPVDTYIRAGWYPHSPTLPYTPGLDAAGVVEATGDEVSRIRVGDRVYLSGSLTGTYAEMALCTQAQVHHLPDRLSFQQGAGVSVPCATAYRALFDRAGARAGDVILVHGGSGGVGTAAIQLARGAGLTVMATAGTEEGRQLLARQGAHYVLDHKDLEHFNQVMALTQNRGVDVILEMLANVNLDNDLKILARGGRVVVIGSRGRIEIDPRATMARDVGILGLSLMNASPEDMVRIHAAVGAALANGTLCPVVGRELPLAKAPRAHHQIMESPAQGKIVLIP